MPSTATSTTPDIVSFSSFVTQLRPKLTTPQFFWFLGHVLTLFNSLTYTLFSFFSYNLSKKYYNYALLSIIATYFIVLFQIFKASKLSFFNPKNLIGNDNFHYLFLAVVWYLVSNTKVVSSGLYPFIIFSVFHSLSYFKNYILPILPKVSSQTKANISNLINNVVTQYNEQSLYAAANLEILILGQLIVGSPLILFQLIKNFRLALVNIVVLIHFISFTKFRYRHSKYTKSIFDGYLYKADVIAQSGRIPSVLVNYYYNAKTRVTGLLKLIPF